MESTGTGAVVHLIAELTGIAPAQLHDRALLGGLLIAAAGAAGLHAAHPPTLHTHGVRGVDAFLLLDGGHASVHAQAPQHSLLLDLLAHEPVDLARALDVFRRRLAPAAVSAERIVRTSRPS
ncbi:MAG: S-adenosylmethionine decarboxylase [Gemmatimonadaceae bacterium]|jgi:S-adenosylmethionine/arginine decarboxylase-like enzyme|nr:S-adenosylmethionine decarboxylase [Gemmatimonadaceae bacterium]